MWQKLCLESRQRVIEQLACIWGELLQTSFTDIGSLYEDPVSGSFFVGPNAPPVSIERPRAHRGPWPTARQQMLTLMADQLTEILSDEEKIRSERRKNKADDSNFDIEEFKALYTAILHLVENVKLLDIWKPSFSLSHPDLTGNNILVGYHDPTSVVGIIDWEGARIQPWVRFGAASQRKRYAYRRTVLIQWQTCPPVFICNQMDRADDGSDSGLTWYDVKKVWDDNVLRVGPRDLLSETTYFLGRLDLLVDLEFVTWTTMDDAVDTVMEWRLKWPQPDDPAFGPLDHVLRLHGQNSVGAVTDESTCRSTL